LKEARGNNKAYCAKYRQKKKMQKLKEKLRTAESNRNDDEASTQCNSVSSSSDINPASPSSTFSNTMTRSHGLKLLVQFPFRPRSMPSKKRSKALRKACNEIGGLQRKLKAQERSAKKWQKRFERLKQVKAQRNLNPWPKM